MALIDEIMMKPSTITSSSVIQGKDASKLTMDDFFNLLVAQLTNQDMMNPVNDTEFIAQMAQFSALQGIQTIQEYQLSSYAASYVGKYVTISNLTKTGELETITGYVEGVNFYEGSPKVVVNGKNYDLYTVMEVSNAAGAGSLNEAASYVGKRVTVSYKDEFGDVKEVSGIVSAVTIKDNVPHVVIWGKEYSIGSITSVNTAEEDSEDEGESSGNATASAASGGASTAGPSAIGDDRDGDRRYPSENSRREVNDM